MSLDTYDNLKQEIIDFSHREDIDERVDTFIRMAESDMFANPDEILRVRGQEVRLETVTSGQFLSLPADFQSMRSVQLVTGNGDCELKYRAPAQMKQDPGTGRPLYFTVTSQIEFERVPDTDYDIILQYYAIPTPLSSSNQTNAILNTFPNIYLFGALAATFTYASDSMMAAQHYASFIRAIKGANKKDKQGRHGPAPAMTPAGTVV
jgi:hypothetical protein